MRERKDRLEQGGEWLRAQRQARDWTQTELAAHLGIDQTKVSAYENGRYEMSVDLARDIARVFEVTEWQVWRGLRLPLPRELDDDEAIARAEELLPEVMQKVPGRKPRKATPLTRGSVSRHTNDTRKSEKRQKADPGRESAV